MSEKLHARRLVTIGRLAQSRIDIPSAGNAGLAQHNILRESRASREGLDPKLGDLRLVLGDRNIELEVLIRRRGHGDESRNANRVAALGLVDLGLVEAILAREVLIGFLEKLIPGGTRRARESAAGENDEVDETHGWLQM